MIAQTNGKTLAVADFDIHQSLIKGGDTGFIDGYVTGGDGRPYAVFVRLSDGLIDLVPTHSIRACHSERAARRGEEE